MFTCRKIKFFHLWPWQKKLFKKLITFSMYVILLFLFKCLFLFSITAMYLIMKNHDNFLYILLFFCYYCKHFWNIDWILENLCTCFRSVVVHGIVVCYATMIVCLNKSINSTETFRDVSLFFSFIFMYVPLETTHVRIELKKWRSFIYLIKNKNVYKIYMVRENTSYWFCYKFNIKFSL